MQYDTVEKAVKSALKRFGKIDILVNCKSFLYIVYIFVSIVYSPGHFKYINSCCWEFSVSSQCTIFQCLQDRYA